MILHYNTTVRVFIQEALQFLQTVSLVLLQSNLTLNKNTCFLMPFDLLMLVLKLCQQFLQPSSYLGPGVFYYFT